ncbi:hypothetical protein HPB48_024032 [Haemaphysalis longicornis]|uniref:Peptidase M13 N-terminal domain-containing protein n=1 Tax=Haemaphysalis longicornis TaxID=44386 RepID=A0A9J6H8X7_HAELO|nr:hypothetical protein HPB48_024032 [Haemaphysalis longicornis]
MAPGGNQTSDQAPDSDKSGPYRNQAKDNHPHPSLTPPPRKGGHMKIIVGVLVIVVIVLAALLLLHMTKAMGSHPGPSTDVISSRTSPSFTASSFASPYPSSSSTSTFSSPPSPSFSSSSLTPSASPSSHSSTSSSLMTPSSFKPSPPPSPTSKSTSKPASSAKPTSGAPRTDPPLSCDSDACRRVTTQLRRGLLRDSPPCDDFHRYVCGAWEGPAYEEQLFQKFVDDVAKESRAQTGIPRSGQTAKQRAALAYQSCEDIILKNSTNMATVKLILKEAGFFSKEGWGHPVDILNASFFLAITWRIASPYRIEYRRHTSSVFTLRIGPSQSAVAYVRRRDNQTWEARSKEDFEQMKATFQPDGDPKISYGDWKNIDNHVTTEWRGILTTDYSPGTGIECWTETTVYNFVYGMNQTDWDLLLSKYFESTGALKFCVHLPHLFRNFAAIPSSASARLAQAFYRWYMVEILANVVYAPWVSRRHGGYQSALEHQRRFCFAIMEKSAGYAFLAPYVDKKFPRPVVDDIAHMLRQVRGAYGKLFAHSFRPDISLLPSYEVNSGRVFKLLHLTDDSTLEEHYVNYKDMTEDPLVNWRRLRTGLTKSFPGDVTMDSPGAVIKSLRFFMIDLYRFGFHLRPDVSVLPFFDPSLPSALKLAGLGTIMASAMVEVLLIPKIGWSEREFYEWNKSHACMHAGLRLHADLLKRTVALATVASVLKPLTDKFGPILKGEPDMSGAKLLFIAWCHLTCGEKEAQQLCNEPLRELNVFFDTFECHRPSERMTKANKCTDGWFEV